MTDEKNMFVKEIEKIWPKAKKNISKINKDVVKLMKKSEKNLADFYADTKKKTQVVIAKAKREELYYELGKSVASLLTSQQLKNKNVLRISMEIRQLNKKLRSKK